MLVDGGAPASDTPRTIRSFCESFFSLSSLFLSAFALVLFLSIRDIRFPPIRRRQSPTDSDTPKKEIHFIRNSVVVVCILLLLLFSVCFSGFVTSIFQRCERAIYTHNVQYSRAERRQELQTAAASIGICFSASILHLFVSLPVFFHCNMPYEWIASSLLWWLLFPTFIFIGGQVAFFDFPEPENRLSIKFRRRNCNEDFHFFSFFFRSIADVVSQQQ